VIQDVPCVLPNPPRAACMIDGATLAILQGHSQQVKSTLILEIHLWVCNCPFAASRGGLQSARSGHSGDHEISSP
jgi:hypothetical protein